MMINFLKTGLAMAGLILLTGCAGVISDPVVQQVNRQAQLSTVLEDPSAYEGEMVLWSGRIVRTEPLKEGALIEVLQTPAGFNRRPPQSDVTEGRFLALNPEFLDPAVYEEGREITVAGRIREIRTRPLGEIDYTYPLVDVEELHLWPLRPGEVYLRDADLHYRPPYRYWGCPGYWCW